MKTIVSLALAGLMSISALLPALAAQEAESVSIPENPGISESMAQDESSVSSSGSTADESTEPESGSNAENESDSIPQSESGSMSVESDSSIADGSEAETGSSLPVSDSMAFDEMNADSEPVSGSETTESDVDAEDEDSSGVTEAAADEQSVPVTVSEEYAILLATNQADSMMGHAGMRRSSTCKQLVESFILADYTADNEENAYKLLWAALNQAIASLSEEGGGIGQCVYGSGTIRLYR